MIYDQPHQKIQLPILILIQLDTDSDTNRQKTSSVFGHFHFHFLSIILDLIQDEGVLDVGGVSNRQMLMLMMHTQRAAFLTSSSLQGSWAREVSQTKYSPKERGLGEVEEAHPPVSKRSHHLDQNHHYCQYHHGCQAGRRTGRR